jgi:hypothetical protein
MAMLIAVPAGDVPEQRDHGLDRLLPITVIALAWSDIALAALAYRTTSARRCARGRSSSRGRSASRLRLVVHLAPRRADHRLRLSMVAALVAALIPLLKSYGMPRGWKPDPATPVAHGASQRARSPPPTRSNGVAAHRPRRARRCSSRRRFVGIYYVAQNVATLPAKLKTSFDPILGPVIARNIAAGDKAAVAKQVRQVGFWVIAAQLGSRSRSAFRARR